MNLDGFPIDLILFGLIAAFLVLRLRSILGRRTGYEGPPPVMQRGGRAPVIEGRAEPVAQARPARPLPDPASPAGQGLALLRAASPGFDAARFLDGAEQAFRLIVAAYAKNDRAALRPLLTDDTYRAFDAAITAREAQGETIRSEIRRIADATITSAILHPQAETWRKLADITVRFVSDQVNVTLDRAGRPVAGVDAVTEIADLWTFERDLAGSDPAWRLAAARSD